MMIESSKNPQFQEWLSLLESRGIKKTQKFFIFGEKVLREALKRGHAPDIILDPSMDTVFESLLDDSDVKLRKAVVSAPLFKELDIFGTHFPLGILTLPEIAEWQVNEKPQGLEVMLALQDPSNLGTAIRSCEAFGVRKIILLKECAHPFHPKSMRASSGSVLRMTFASGPSIRELHDVQDTVALDMVGQKLNATKWPKDVRILLGEEGPGVPQNLDIPRAQIPTVKTIDSLNAATALAIALYDYNSKN